MNTEIFAIVLGLAGFLLAAGTCAFVLLALQENQKLIRELAKQTDCPFACEPLVVGWPHQFKPQIPPMKLLLGISLVFIKMALLPSANLLGWMGIAIALDFVTGFSKAVVLKQARTSNGMRKTITKFLQYGGALAAGILLSQAAAEKGAESLRDVIGYLNDGLVVFIIYIEVTSIFENLVAIDQTSAMSKYFFGPMLRILTAQFKKLPVVVAGDNAETPAV